MSIASPLQSTSSLSLPSYTPSSASPRYSPEPLEDEQRLVFVARKIPQGTPSGAFVKKAGSITLLLSGQESGVGLPSYTRTGSVRGEVLFDDEASINTVVIKLEGRQTITIVEGGTSLEHLFTDTQTIWPRESTDGSSTPACPAVLPFSLPFPSGYDIGTNRKPLPPSFGAQFPGISGLYAECKYTFSVTVTKTGLGGWKRQKSLSTEVLFQPRSRPYMPIGTDLQPFFSTVKSAPGDWHQVISTMGTSEKSTLQPLECHLFIPSVQIYAISDVVPFHIHLHGSRASLLAFLSGPTPASPKLSKSIKALGSTLKITSSSPRPSMESETSQSSQSATAIPENAPLSYNSSGIRVYFLRQVCVRVNGQKSWKDIVLGEGKLWPLNSQYPFLREDGPDGECSLDWEGEVRCGSDVSVGSFTSGDLIVKDFIVTELRPPSTQSSLKRHQHAHPIRLVTDSYADS